MYFISAFGLLMIILSIIMIVNPNYWSIGIVNFSKKTYFHWFEVFSRLIAGLVFIHYSETTLYPPLILSIGYLLLAVGLGLVIIGSVKHRRFAVWSAHQFKNTFRPAGFVSFILGSFLIYIASFGS